MSQMMPAISPQDHNPFQVLEELNYPFNYPWFQCTPKRATPVLCRWQVKTTMLLQNDSLNAYPQVSMFNKIPNQCQFVLQIQVIFL